LTPTLLVLIGLNKDAVNAHNIPHITIAAFVIGAVFSLASISWTLATTEEIALSDKDLADMRAKPGGLSGTMREIVDAIRDMPLTMRQLAVMKLFQWYALFCYWQYIVLCLAKSLYGTSDPASTGFRDAGLLNGQIGAFYNFIAFVGALSLVPVVRKFGAKATHAVCLVLAGIGMLAIPDIKDQALLFLPMIGVGLAWGSIMGNPYVLLAGSIPAHRVGVYMGIFNMFIVIPMMIQIFTLPLFYRSLLGGDPANVIRLAGGLMLCAAVATLFVQPGDSEAMSATAAN
jgi:maltose/moltooligosaccharide transporter